MSDDAALQWWAVSFLESVPLTGSHEVPHFIHTSTVLFQAFSVIFGIPGSRMRKDNVTRNGNCFDFIQINATVNSAY